MDFTAYTLNRTKRLEAYLDLHLPPETNANPLNTAMRYAVLNGGKRLRPLLVYMTGEALGAPLDTLDAPAAAVELIHCYSLVHDDLPAMDDDDLRRGKPSCHKAFDEATAILVGDALQAFAFQILSDSAVNILSPQQQISMIQLLAKNSGSTGMVGGQALDLAAEKLKGKVSLDTLHSIHQQKTGALIEASVLLGVLATGKIAEIEKDTMANLQTFAQLIGLSFQVQDDILDVIGDSALLGKSIGKDQRQEKATFPAFLGLEGAKQYAQDLHQQALKSIAFLKDKDNYLAQLSEDFVNRTA